MTVPTPATIVTRPATALYVRVLTSEQDLAGLGALVACAGVYLSE